MEKSLATFKRIKGYIDKNAPGRDWNLATAMLIRGEAGMQVMGDWVKGEFLAAAKAPGKDFGCVAAPGTADVYTCNVDTFAMFKVKDPANQKAQQVLAAAILSPAFQEVFNPNKGSIPVRSGTPLDKFDECAKKSDADFKATQMNGGQVRSVAHDMAVAPAIQGAMNDAVSTFWNDDKATPRGDDGPAARGSEVALTVHRATLQSVRPQARVVASRLDGGGQAPKVHSSDHETRSTNRTAQEPAMTKTFTQAAAVAFAAFVTAATFAGANGLAKHEYARADVAATAGQQVVAMQTVVVVGRRAKA